MTDQEFTQQLQELSFCRICQVDQENGRLIKPCNCNGTMEFVHVSCLQNWIAISSRLNCEICTCSYQGRKVYKYGVLNSIMPYMQARWHQPKINFSLLIIFRLVEQMFAELRDFYLRSQKYRNNTSKYRLFSSILFRCFDYLLYPQTFLLLVLAFRDWSAWRQTQIVFLCK